MSTVVDANVVIAWQTPDHVFHADAVRLIGDAEPALYMHELNLAEVLVGLDRNDWPHVVTTLVEMGFEFVTTDAIALAAARVDGRVRMPDACVLAAARTTGAAAVLTFDATLRAAAAASGYLVNDVAVVRGD